MKDSKSHNNIIFEQREILGVDEYSVINLFVKKVIISENMVKYKFNENWDPKTKKYKENIVGLTIMLSPSKTSLIAGNSC